MNFLRREAPLDLRSRKMSEQLRKAQATESAQDDSHVFISYVRQNTDMVDRLYNELTSRGIEVWGDRNDIAPGTRWKQAIRRAIQEGAFFIACFSLEYNARSTTYMNEELTLAIDVLRQRPTDQSWFIPVKLSECDIPDRDIGNGETLRDIQWVELYKDWDDGIRRIIEVIGSPERIVELERIVGKDDKDDVEMLLIPAGEFQMGSNDGDDDEKPVHMVDLDAFYIDVYSVTNAQYREFIEATRHPEPEYWNDERFNQPKQPVVGVTWYDAMAYAQWAGKRLPTEAEWEKAARGGLAGKKYPWGDEEPGEKMANYAMNVGQTTPVGAYPKNGYGLYDMAGNVWEWCLDEYQADFYKTNPQRNPLAGDNLSELLANYKDIKTARVLRGGSWLYNPYDLRAAVRYSVAPEYWYVDIGFRCSSPCFP